MLSCLSHLVWIVELMYLDTCVVSSSVSSHVSCMCVSQCLLYLFNNGQFIKAPLGPINYPCNFSVFELTSYV